MPHGDELTTRIWRPKLTVYRALVLLITIGLGSAKAYATSRDSTLATITIEWIAGVGLFSIIFILGLLESNPPHFLLPLFNHDLIINLPFRSIFCCASRRRYFTDGDWAASATTYKLTVRPPLVTGYRLLTSVSVTSLGVVKACLAYQNDTLAVNAIDWISGVLLTSSLYILGLYEDNPVGLMPYLFFVDYTPFLRAGSHVFGMLCCCLWIGYWLKVIVTPLPGIRAVYNGTDKLYGVHRAPTNTFQGIHNLTQFAFEVFGCLFISSFMGVLCFGLILFQFIETFGGEGKWMKAFGAIRRTALTSFGLVSQVTRSIGRVSWLHKPLRGFHKVAHFLRRFSLHIFVYGFCTLLTGIVTFNLLGGVFVLWFEVDSPSLFTYLFAAYFTIISGIPISMVGFMCGYCLMLLVAPFRVDWDAPEYKRTWLELGESMIANGEGLNV